MHESSKIAEYIADKEAKIAKTFTQPKYSDITEP